jgi:hypothetical protein
MALGDSLYNGVQSLRINWWLSEWSAPTYVAIGMGLVEERNGDRTGRRSFYDPQYPDQDASPAATRSYGFDLEALSLRDLKGIASDQAKRLQTLAFDYRPPNKRAFVDNLAVAGFNTSDLYAWRAKDYRAAAEQALAKLRSGSFGAVADAFFYANAYFVLNPMKSKCIDELTPLDQVKLRKPKRLLINIGSNNGLWLMSFQAATTKAPTCNNEPFAVQAGRSRCMARNVKEFLDTRYRTDVAKIFNELSHVDGLEYVFFNGIGKPSQPANLIFNGGTFNSALFGRAKLTKKELAAGDLLAEKTNEFAKNLAVEYNSRGKGPKFVFVDVAATLDRYDYKGCLLRNKAGVCAATRRFEINRDVFSLGKGAPIFLDNRPQQLRGNFGYVTGTSFDSKLEQGGLFSFDNMHLSSVGYELLAKQVFDAVQSPTNGGSGYEIEGDQCKSKNNKVGDCRSLLITPGWSFADSTRREFNFLRTGGAVNTHRKDFVRFMYLLASVFF